MASFIGSDLDLLHWKLTEQDESASLQRARKPFMTRNFLTGAAIVSFIVGTYAYSIAAVKQDDFVGIGCCWAAGGEWRGWGT